MNEMAPSLEHPDANRQGNSIPYPHFSQDHQHMLSSQDPDRSSQPTAFSSNALGSQYTDGEDTNMNIEPSNITRKRRQVSDNVNSARALRGFRRSFERRNPAQSNGSAPLLDNSRAEQQAKDSFATTTDSAVYSFNVTDSEHPSFHETPFSSFGEEPNIPYNESDTYRTGARRRVPQELATEQRAAGTSGVIHRQITGLNVHQNTEGQRVSSTTANIGNGDLVHGESAPVRPMSGLSQLTRTQEEALLQIENPFLSEPGQNPAHPNLTNTLQGTSALPVKSQATSFLSPAPTQLIPSPCEALHSLMHDSKSPFEDVNFAARDLPLRVVYEVSRLVTATKCSPDAVLDDLQTVDEHDYGNVYQVLRKFSEPGKSIPRISQAVWAAASENFDHVCLSGKLERIESPRNSLLLRFSIRPMRTQPTTNRLIRKYGAHRFFVLNVPNFDDDSLRTTFIKWLVDNQHAFLGRIWRAFYVKKGESDSTTPWPVCMFATDGYGLESVSHEKMLKQLLYLQKNQAGQPALKLFSRIGLGLTDTTATMIFDVGQIIFTDDAMSCCPARRDIRINSKRRNCVDGQPHSGKVMSDGAARISYSAALRIVQILKLKFVPTAFQARIGGAKGVWIVDRSCESRHTGQDGDIWIEIAESQIKFKVATKRRRAEDRDGSSSFLKGPVDPHQYTFEVHSYSHALKPHYLNDTLIPILKDRGVPDRVFLDLQKEDFERQKSSTLEALEMGGAHLMRWIYETQPVVAERLSAGEMSMSGAFPTSRGEGLVTLVASGAHPKEDFILYKMCTQAVRFHCEQLGGKNKMELPRSTYALMIPDPLAILEEGEVHIGFSEPFESSDNGTLLHHLNDLDVIVTRFPAYLPADVQKVRAVHKPELAVYGDVVIFPVKTSNGRPGLAEHLSGGDFDGDKAFICWEPSIVQNFENAKFREAPSPESLGIRKDKVNAKDLISEGGINAFIKKGLEFNMKKSMLGACANWYMAYNYQRGSIDSQMDIGSMLGMLVDAPKQGYVFGKGDWKRLLKQLDLDSALPKPFWQDKQDFAHRERPRDHVLDDLCQQRWKCQQSLIDEFDRLQDKIPLYNQIYAHVFNNEEKVAEHSIEIQKIIKKLGCDINDFFDWFVRRSDHLRQKENRFSAKRKVQQPYEQRQRTYGEFLDEAHLKFLAIKPAETNDIMADRFLQDWSNSTQESPKGWLSTMGSWGRLRASALYKMTYSRSRNSHLPWLVAGRELCQMRAESRDPHSLPVLSNIRFILKPDRRLLDCLHGPMIPPAITEDEFSLDMNEDGNRFNDAMSTAGTLDDLYDDDRKL